MKALKLISVVAFLGVVSTGLAQKVVAYQQSSNNKTTIAGTSTLHDWTMASGEATYDAKFEVNTDGVPTQLVGLNYSLAVESLKSGKNAMDKNAYNAMSTEKHKKITFALISSTTTEDSKIKAIGNLTIAGTTKSAGVEASCKHALNGELTCSAKATLKMTDYNVEPPTFMFGSIKTGNEITLNFTITLSPTKL